MGGWMIIGWMELEKYSNNHLIWKTIDNLNSDLIIPSVVCNVQLMVFSQATYGWTAYVKHKDFYFSDCQPGWHSTPVLAPRLPLTLNPLYS